MIYIIKVISVLVDCLECLDFDCKGKCFKIVELEHELQGF